MTNTELVKALAAFQKELPEVGLDATNPAFRSKYATLSAVTKAVIPKLTEHGFAFSVGSFVDNGLLIVDAHLLHESGESRSLQFPITETNPQKIGGAITYARRYALSALTGIVADEDDDGNAASQPSPTERALDQARNTPRPATAAAQRAAAPKGDLAIANERIRNWIKDSEERKTEVNTKIEGYKAAGSDALGARKKVIAELEIPELEKV